MDLIITDYKFKYYPNWQLVEEPGFDDRGLYDGKWESFYIDGATSKKFSYAEGKRDKIWMSYYQDGRRENYTFYTLDTLITDYEFTYYKNLQIMEEPKFSKDGLFDGKWQQFYEGGETKMTFYYEDGLKDQICMSYFPDNRRQNYTFYNQDTLITNYDFKYYDNIEIVDNPDYYDYEYYMNLQVVEEPRYDNLQIVEEPKFDNDTDIRGPFSLITIIESQGPVNSNIPVFDLSKIMIFADSDFVTNKWFYSNQNSDMILNSLAWLAEDYEVISIRPKVVPFRSLVVNRREREFLKWSSGLPFILMITTSVVVWWRRR